jgi:hypothetical protein
MQKAATTLGNQLNSQLGKGVTPYTESMVPGLSTQTQAGVDALTNNPNNSIFSSGVSGALGQQAQIAQGNFGADPVRQRISDDALLAVQSGSLTDGRFGSSAMLDDAAQSVTGALANYDYGRQQQAINNMGSLYSMGNMPAAANLQAGQLMDQYNAAKAQDDYRIFDATKNAGWNTLQRGASIFSGTAPVTGTTTTQTQQTPWWQVPAQIGGTVLGAMF